MDLSENRQKKGTLVRVGDLNKKHLYGAAYSHILDRTSVRLDNLICRLDLDETKDFLDFGCGAGALLSKVAYKVASYTGIDTSGELIQKAETCLRNYPGFNARFICSSLEKFAEGNKKTIDVGVIFDVSEHMEDDLYLSALVSLRKMFRAEGKLYLHTPNGSFFLEVMKKNNFIFKQIDGHIAIRNVEENVSILKRAGFKNICVDFLPHYNILRYVHFFSRAPIVGMYFQARLFISAQI